MPKPIFEGVIKIDTREQRPFDFSGYGISTEVGTLASGDYSLAGYESQVAIERKSLDDFIRSIIHERERFFAELRRLQEMSYAAIVVEGSLVDIFGKRYHGDASTESVLGSTVAIMVDFGIPVLFCGNRPGAAWMTAALLKRFWLNARKSEGDSAPEGNTNGGDKEGNGMGPSGRGG
jgi:ERCC4-type nuclease